jgi:hypothetical protein
MCMAIYLAANEALRLVEWDDAAPGFHTLELQSGEEQVRSQFAKRHVVYAGSYEGCGCGFQLGRYPGDSERDLDAGRRSLLSLAAYLREELRRVGSIDVFACWEGDQEDAPEHQRTLTPGSLESQRFFFLERELSTITPDVHH